ncbi:MAG: glycosyltransferase family 2 protein [Gaiellaceae bacterium]
MSAAETAVYVTDDTRERGHAYSGATLVRPEDVQSDVPVTPPYLTRSYACYRALRESAFSTAVYLDPADAYCAARARETGTGMATTEVVVDCGKPTLRAVMRERRSYVSKNVLGRIAAERLALELADGYVCADPDVDEWLRARGWRLPPRAEERPRGEGRRREVTLPRDPAVSVVVPYHERTDYLSFCLEGLARQTYSPLDVLVADAGSTSSAARAQLAEVEQRTWPWPLRVVTSAAGGPAVSRNAGWSEARGELVTFIDDDDVPFDDMIERLWRARAVSGADVAVGGARLFRGEGPPAPHGDDVVRIPLCDPHELGLISNQYGGPVALWPRTVLDRLQGFTPSAVEDWLLLARATQHGVRLTAPPDPVHWYRQTSTGRHSADPVRMRDSGLPQLADVFAERLPEDLRLLPLLAAGAYAELERRTQPRASRLRSVRSFVRRVARR